MYKRVFVLKPQAKHTVSVKISDAIVISLTLFCFVPCSFVIVTLFRLVITSELSNTQEKIYRAQLNSAPQVLMQTVSGIASVSC